MLNVPQLTARTATQRNERRYVACCWKLALNLTISRLIRTFNEVVDIYNVGAAVGLPYEMMDCVRA